MAKWYLATMDYIVGCFSTKREALQNVDAFHFRCHKQSYGYSIDVKDECEGWHNDTMWLFRDREQLIRYKFEAQLAEYEEVQYGSK